MLLRGASERGSSAGDEGEPPRGEACGAEREKGLPALAGLLASPPATPPVAAAVAAEVQYALPHVLAAPNTSPPSLYACVESCTPASSAAAACEELLEAERGDVALRKRLWPGGEAITPVPLRGGVGVA
jgi:hypothetical protein